MATHAQGKDTQNISVNLLEEERRAFGRIAVAEDRSLGDIMRRLATEALRERHPEAYDLLIALLMQLFVWCACGEEERLYFVVEQDSKPRAAACWTCLGCAATARAW